MAKVVHSLDEEIECVKCHNPSRQAVAVRANESLCRDCFLHYVTHKVRSAIGKTKAICCTDHVLVAFSGGAASSALLNFIHEGRAFGRMRFSVTLLHINELNLLPMTADVKLSNIEKVIRLMERHGFPYIVSCLEEALDADEGGGDYLSLGRDSVCMEMGVIKGWADQEKKGTQSLCRLLSSLTVSDSEELLRILRLRLCVKVARVCGVTKVVVGDTADHIAVTVMTHLAEGRGAQVSCDSVISDDRYGDVVVIRPLKDVTMKEVEAYSQVREVRSVVLPQVSRQWPSSCSIDALTRGFLEDLRSRFPSTVSAIVKTSNKLRPLEHQVDAPRCITCQSVFKAIDGETSAIRSVDVSANLSLPLADRCIANDTKETADCLASSPLEMPPDRLTSRRRLSRLPSMLPGLCYGCQRMLKDVDFCLLPDYVKKGVQSFAGQD